MTNFVKSTEYWENWFTESQEEKDIQKEIDDLETAFYNTPEYNNFRDTVKGYYARKNDARKKRLDLYKDQKPSRKIVADLGEKKRTDEERIAWVEKKRQRRLDDFNALDDRLKQLILDYSTLPEDSKKKFDRECDILNWKRHEEPDEYKNPVTTKEKLSLLHDVLVQTCIDFINDHNLTDIEEISFSADSLQTSARHNEWTPTTDSFLGLYGYEKENEFDKYPVRKKIASEM